MVYTWQVDGNLNDLFADTIIPSTRGTEQIFTNTKIFFSGNNDLVYAAVWSWKKPTLNAVKLQNNSLMHIAPVFDEGPVSNIEISSTKNSGSRNAYSVTVDDDFPAPYSSEYNNATAIPQTESIIPGNYLNTQLALFSLDGNSVKWQHLFNNKIDSSVSVDLSEAKVIYKNKAVHIIYNVYPNHKNALAQVTINEDGTFTRNEFTGWQTGYNYVLANAVFTNDALFVPCTNSNKIRFARINIQ